MKSLKIHCVGTTGICSMTICPTLVQISQTRKWGKTSKATSKVLKTGHHAIELTDINVVLAQSHQSQKQQISIQAPFLRQQKGKKNN